MILSGNSTIARRIQPPSGTFVIGTTSDAANEAGMVLGPNFEIPSTDRGTSPEFYEHSIRFVSGTNIDVGVILSGGENANASSPLSPRHSITSSSSMTSSSYFRRFFIPSFSKVSVRIHRDHSVSFAVDDKPNGAAFCGLASAIGVHGVRIAVILNSKNDCVEIVD